MIKNNSFRRTFTDNISTDIMNVILKPIFRISTDSRNNGINYMIGIKFSYQLFKIFFDTIAKGIRIMILKIT